MLELLAIASALPTHPPRVPLSKPEPTMSQVPPTVKSEMSLLLTFTPYSMMSPFEMMQPLSLWLLLSTLITPMFELLH